MEIKLSSVKEVESFPINKYIHGQNIVDEFTKF